MKNILFIGALILNVLSICVLSCTEDFLDQKPTSTLTELTYYKNVDELETGLTACYAAIIWNWTDNFLWGFGDVGSDDADKGSIDMDQADLLEVSYSRQNAANNWVLWRWNAFYIIIARCNQVIDRSAGTQGDPGEIEKIVDQAKFIRAMSFYHLVTEFGDVPLADRFLYPDELMLKRAPADSVWVQIESDLIDATNLPTVSQWEESGRVTSGAAWAMLGKVYLTEKKYLQATHAFSKVVRSEKYHLVPDFGFIFRHEGENCDESIFEFQYWNNIQGEVADGTSPYRLPRDPGQGWGFDCPTKDLFDEFEPGDPRIIYTFMFKGDVFPMGNETYTVLNKESPTGYNSRKAWIPYSERENWNWWEFDFNYRYMRYAEVLLLYAESLNEVNKQDSARLLVNMIRERARNIPTTDEQRISCAYPLPHPEDLLPDVTTNNQSELRQAIWHEQRVELATEGHRRDALLRTGRFKECMEKAKAYAGVIVEQHEWLLPIPEQEITLSNGLLTQNPGY
jgi:hypothetical protein